MQSSIRNVRLTRPDARVLARACSTFVSVPFSSEKPQFDPDITPFLDILWESIHEKREQLTNPDGDVFVSLSLVEIRQLLVVLESILSEYANIDMELELHVAPRGDVLACLSNLKKYTVN